MPSIDMPLEQLRQYKPSLNRPDDFDAFWQTTVAEAIAQPLNGELVPYQLPLRGLQAYAVRFDGYKGDAKQAGRIAGWYVRPEGSGHYPGLCVFHGYGGRGARPLEVAHIAAQGVCVLSMDCRGQNGQSQDLSVVNEGHYAGWLTQGIRDPRTYYYRHVYADALRLIELLAGREEVDATRLAVTGVSQGGGLSLATAALSERVTLAVADVPFLCDFRRAVQIMPQPPYPEIASFLKGFPDLYETAFRTLSYFDCLNLAPRIRCRTVVSSSLWDDVCPPSTIFGVFHHISAEKQLEIYPFHKHEVPYEQTETRFRLLMEALRPGPDAPPPLRLSPPG